MTDTYRIFGRPAGYDEDTVLGEILAVSKGDAMTQFLAQISATLRAEAEEECGEDVDDIAVPAITRAERITDEDRVRTADLCASWEAVRDVHRAALAADISPWSGESLHQPGGDAGDYLDSKP